MKSIEAMTTGRWWTIAMVFSAGLLLAAALRYGILENEAHALMCREQAASAWCSVRSALGWSIHFQLFGLAGLALGIAAWLPGLRRLALGGLLFAGCGLVIYNTTYAAVATVVALLSALQPSVRFRRVDKR